MQNTLFAEILQNTELHFPEIPAVLARQPAICPFQRWGCCLNRRKSKILIFAHADARTVGCALRDFRPRPKVPISTLVFVTQPTPNALEARGLVQSWPLGP